MSYLYILTDSEKINANLYRISTHTGDLNKLLKRHRPYFPQPIILFFEPINHPQKLLSKIRNKFKANLQENLDGTSSKWFEGNIHEVISFILRYINTAGKLSGDIALMESNNLSTKDGAVDPKNIESNDKIQEAINLDFKSRMSVIDRWL